MFSEDRILEVRCVLVIKVLEKKYRIAVYVSESF